GVAQAGGAGELGVARVGVLTELVLRKDCMVVTRRVVALQNSHGSGGSTGRAATPSRAEAGGEEVTLDAVQLVAGVSGRDHSGGVDSVRHVAVRSVRAVGTAEAHSNQGNQRFS